MIGFSLLCMICMLIAFEGGIAVLRLNRRCSINIVYAVFAFNFVLCCIFFNQYVTAPNKSVSRFWNLALAFPGSMNPSFMLHFSILLISENERLPTKLLLPLIYLPSLLIGLMWILGRSIRDVYSTPWGWDIYSEPGNFWVSFSFVLFIILCFLSFFLVLYRYRKPQSKRNRKQMRPVMFSLLLGTAGWIISLSLFFTESDFLHTLISNISFLIIVTPFTIGVRLAIARYHLMTLTPQRQAAELIAGMNDPVFLIDMEGFVVFRNKPADKLIINSDRNNRMDKIENFNLCDLFICSDQIRKELESIAGGRSPGNYLQVTSWDAEQLRSTYILKIQGIKNEVNEYIGAMCTISQESSPDDFQSRFGITPRETDIIMLSISGLTNREIANRLMISQRTVEHHHGNIYNKLGIDNKIELYNIAKKYRLISN